MFQLDLKEENKAIISHYRALLRKLNPAEEDQKLIRKAFNIALDAHKDMRRKSGEPYIYHPLEVAHITSDELGLGTTSIICALLHDVVEDTEYTLEDIERQFGSNVSKIINGLTKIEDMFDQQSSSIQAENFKKILLTLSDDIRVILIKLADRLHNMRTLDSMAKNKQLKIASETLFIYAPLAHRLGLFNIKSELEDLGLKYTEPEIYHSIKSKLGDSKPLRNQIIDKFIQPIQDALKKQDIHHHIESIEKSVFSLWDIMQEKEMSFEEVTEVNAIKIIVDSPLTTEKADCWRVYSIITDFYRPNLEKLRDWISIPKTNGYEALHTTVMSDAGIWVEVQIRSVRMEQIAQKGFAAQRKMQNEGLAGPSNLDRWLNRLKDHLHVPEGNALDFLEDFKGYLFSDEIFVFTPQGELRNLPVDSTALDFAYAIHSEIGNACIGAKINSKLVPLSQKLKSGDQVEIITSKKQKPREEWYEYVVTTRAKTQIKDAIKSEKKKYYEEGQEKLRHYLQQINVDMNKNRVGKLMEKYNYASLIDLYYDVALEKIGLKEVKDCCTEYERTGWLSNIIRNPFIKSKSNNKTLTENVLDILKKKPEALLLGDDINRLSYDIARCCNPIPGDDVIGIFKPREPIEIHRVNCNDAIQLMSKYGNNIIKTKWKDKESIGFLSGIKIIGIDKKGFISEIIKIITEKLNLNIRSFNIESTDGITTGEIMLYVYSTENLNELITRLKKIKDIKQVKRINRLSASG